MVIGFAAAPLDLELGNEGTVSMSGKQLKINASTNKFKFKEEYSFDARKAELDRVRAKYPGRVPGDIFQFQALISFSFSCFSQ